MPKHRAAGFVVFLVVLALTVSIGSLADVISDVTIVPGTPPQDFTDGSIKVLAKAEDGSPVAGAEVTCVDWSDRTPRQRPLADSEHGKTDADGACTFPNLRTSQYLIRAKAPTGGALQRVQLGGNDKHAEVSMTVKPQQTLQGIVRDKEGKPLAGVLVCLDRVLPVAETAEDGTFRVDNVEMEQFYEVSLTKSGYGWRMVSRGMANDEIEVEMRQGTSIECTVIHADGRPASNVWAVYHGDVETRTDESGKLRTVPLTPGERVMFRSWYGGKEDRYFAETEVTVGEGPLQQASLQFKPYLTAAVTGKVVMAESGEPVQGRILVDESMEFAFPKKKAHTESDGTFIVKNLAPRPYALTVAPDDPTLYAIDDIVSVDLTAGKTVEALTFKVGRGCAIRGRVLDAEGKPVSAQVMFQPWRRYTAIFSEKEDGNFLIPHLDKTDVVYHLEVSQNGGEKAGVSVGPLSVGQIAEDIEIRLGKERPWGEIAGLVVDTAGKPLTGVELLLQPVGAEAVIGKSDADGRFQMKYKDPGEYRFQMTVVATVGKRENQRRLFRKHRIVEGEAIRLDEGGRHEARLVLEIEPLHAVAGRVTDEAGAPLCPQIHALYAPEKPAGVATPYTASQNPTLEDAKTAPPRPEVYSDPIQGSPDGWFVCERVEREPFLLEFTQGGFQAVVLESGRQFAVGDLAIQVVMKKGPFPDAVSVFTAVTSLDDKEDLWKPAGIDIKEREKQYRELAQQEAPAEPGKTSVAAAPDDRQVRVTDADGNPVRRIYVQAAEPYPQTPDMEKPRGPKEIMDSNDGLYAIHPDRYISADGTAVVRVQIPAEGAPPGPIPITLWPASKVLIRVEDYDGAPVPGLRVGPAGYEHVYLSSNFYSLPETDATGTVTFDLLPPGRRLYRVYEVRKIKDSQMQAPQRPRPPLVCVEVEPGKTYDEKVRWGVPKSGSAEAAFEIWWNAIMNAPMQRPRNQERPPKPDEPVKAALGNLVAGELRKLPSEQQWEWREIAVLAAMARELRLKEAAPEIQAALRRFKTAETDTINQASEALTSALAAAAGDEAVEFLAGLATNTEGPYCARRDALIALGTVRTERSKQAWVRLRDAAYSKTGAPQRRTSYSDSERIAEAVDMVFRVIPCQDPSKGPASGIKIGTGAPRIASDGKTATIYCIESEMSTEVLLERFGDEWMVVGIGGRVMP